MTDRTTADLLADDAGAEARLILDQAEAAGAAEAASGGLVLTVTTGGDVFRAEDGVLSLREAVFVADLVPGEDTIVFAEGLDEVVIGGAGIGVNDDLVIDGGEDGGPAGSGVTIAVAEGVQGGLVADNAALRVEGVAFEGESAQSAVRGFYGDVELDRVSVEGFGVGAVTQFGADLAVSDSVVAGDGVGNDVHLYASRADLSIVRTTLADGDLRFFQSGTTAEIINSTLYNASVRVTDNARVLFDNSTIASADLDFVSGSNGRVEAQGSLFDVRTFFNSSFGSGGLLFESNGNNVFTDEEPPGPNTILLDASDVTGVNPSFLFRGGTAVLADNGGPTPTAALLADPFNPAIDAADPATAPATDQRGFDRVGPPDAGAFEVQEEVGPPPDVTGIELEVTTTEDVFDSRDGELSLREAVIFANARPGEDTITFSEDLAGETVEVLGINFERPVSFTLGGFVGLSVTDGLVIDGGGQAAVRFFDAGQTFGGGLAFFETDGASLSLVDVEVSGKGRAAVDAQDAEVVLRGAELSNDGITGPTGADGDGVDLQGGSLLIEGSDLRIQSRAVDSDDAVVEIVDSQVTAGRGGGRMAPDVALRSEGGELALTDSFVDGQGGAVWADGSFEASGSTFVGRNATVLELDGQALIVNSTIDGFETSVAVTRVVTEVEFGANADATVINTTIPRGTGVGITVRDGADVEVGNSIVFGDFVRFTPEPQPAIDGTITSLGGNVFNRPVDGGARSDLFFIGNRDLTFETGDLADNGGPTPTVALRDDPTNPAIGWAVPELAPAFDQRGFARDADPDAGAFELDAEPALVLAGPESTGGYGMG